MRKGLLLAALVAAIATALPAVASPSVSHDLVMDGRTRTYHVYRPAGLTRDKAVPLVIMLHGGYGTGAQAERSYGWDGEADKGGFVVVYPDGVRFSWNSGGTCCGPAKRDHVNDVAFLDRLIETLVADQHIDPHRVYMTGMSNGAAMTYRYACEGHYPLAAIGPVAGGFSYVCDHKVQAVPVMAIHGLDDRNVPIAGGPGSRQPQVIWQPAEETLALFRQADDCAAPVKQSTGVVTTETSDCSKHRKVELVTVAGAGHQWPGAKPERGLIAWMLRLDPPSKAFNATAKLWDFFAHAAAE